MQTLIPPPASATARPLGLGGRWLGFGLTRRALLLAAAGLLVALPAFLHPRQIRFMLAWDTLLAVLVLFEAVRLPRPEAFTVTRTFLDSPQLGHATRVEVGVRMEAGTAIRWRSTFVHWTDDLHPALAAHAAERRTVCLAQEETRRTVTLHPRERGEFTLGSLYLRYCGPFGLIERWAVAEPHVAHSLGAQLGDQPVDAQLGDQSLATQSLAAQSLATQLVDTPRVAPRSADSSALPQRVRVYPMHQDSRESTEFYLLRARQIEMQKRKLNLRGTGREFESLRDYQAGDELRKISWTATARRGKLVTRQFTVERSQQVWIVIDAGRLSRTAFELRRHRDDLAGHALEPAFAETHAERERAHLFTVTQLDQAAAAAIMLAQVIQQSGDKFAMLAYARDLQQLLPPGTGAAHLRLLIDLLSVTRSDAAEADHLNAVARLKSAQRRRGLIVWISELVDSVGRPELVTAAADLVRRHLVVLVLLKHPEMEELAARTPSTTTEMFHTAAAQEMLERRRATIAQLQAQGVLIVETTAAQVGINAVSKYLEVKAEGLL